MEHACFTGEGHFVVSQEAGVTKIGDSDVEGIVQEDVAGLEVTVDHLGLLFVEILHGLGDLQSLGHPMFQGRKWDYSVGAPLARAVEPVLEGGPQMLGHHPRAVGRVQARPHQLEHEPVPLPRQGLYLLSEEYDAVGVGAEKFSRYALHRHIISPPRCPVYLRRASLPYLLF